MGFAGLLFITELLLKTSYIFLNSFKCCWTTYCFAPCSTLSFELSRAEGAGQSSPLQSKEKLLSRLSPSHRLRYGRCLFPSVVFSLPLTATRVSGESHLALDFTQWTLFQELHPNSSLFLYGALLTTFPIDDKNDEQTGIVFAEPFIYQLGRPPAPSFKCSVPWHRPMAEQKRRQGKLAPSPLVIFAQMNQ